MSEPLKELFEIVLDEEEHNKKIKIGAKVSPENRGKIMERLRRNKDVFTWTHDDMVGIDP